MSLFIIMYISIATLGIIEISKIKVSLVVLKKSKPVDYSKIFLAVAFIVMCFICAFRDPTVGTDTLTYIRSFLSTSFLDLTIDGGEKFEYGYKILVHIIRRFSVEPQAFIAVSTMIMFIGMYKFIRDNCEGYYCIALVIFMAFLYYTYFSAMRQCLALAISVNSYTYLKQKKWVKATIIIFFGGLFHITALASLILIPLSFTEWTRKKIVIAIVASLFGIFLFEQIIGIVIQFIPIYGRYWNNGSMDSSSSGVGIFAVLVGILCVVSCYIAFAKWESFDNKEIRNEFILNLVGSIFALVVNLLGRRYGIFSRITRYFIPFVILLIIHLFRNYAKNKLLLYIGLAILMGVYFYIIMNGNIYKIIPYKLCF